MPLLGPEESQASAQDTFPHIPSLSRETEATTCVILEAYKSAQEQLYCMEVESAFCAIYTINEHAWT